MLKAYVEAQGELSKHATLKDRLAAVYQGMQVWRHRLDSMFSDESGTEAALETWANSLDGWPVWVIQAAFQHCNDRHHHPPMPANVLEACEDLWGEGRRRMVRARKAVADCEKLRPEWCE